ncbi:MAG: ribosomal protein S18-alanine N-acetyltransferase [Sphingomonadales bacterium]|nr:ribosomal protein S18-alanine N-acetyltransferase [Sphingomonadales bacterium]
MTGPAVSARAAQTNDAEAVHVLMCRVFGEASNEVWTTDALSKAFSDGEGVVLESSGHVIGYCLMRRVLDEAEILSIAIDPAHRQKGAGLYLLEHVLAELGQEGVAQVYLEVRESNDQARNLYLKSGFISIGKRKGYYSIDRQSKENAIMYSHTIKSKTD